MEWFLDILTMPILNAAVWQWMLVFAAYAVVVTATEIGLSRWKRENIRRIIAVYRRRGYREDVIRDECEKLHKMDAFEVAAIEHRVLKEWY